MTFLFYHFRCEILWSTRKSLSKFGLVVQLCEAKIDDLDVAFLIKQDVFEFEISMNDRHLMQVPNSHHKLCRIKPNTLFLEPLSLFHDFVKLTASNKRHHEVKSVVILEDIVHIDEERMVHLDHDLFFEECALNLLIFNENVLSDGLNGV